MSLALDQGSCFAGGRVNPLHTSVPSPVCICSAMSNNNPVPAIDPCKGKFKSLHNDLCLRDHTWKGECGTW